jgi:hypothetical protein
MAETIKTNQLPVVTDLTGAKVIGLTGNGIDAAFPLDSLVRNNIGQFKTTDAAPPTPLLNQSYELVGSAVGQTPSGTYTHLLMASSTPLVIPAAATGHAIINAHAIWNGSYWIPVWQDVVLPSTDLTGYAKTTDVVNNSDLASTGSYITAIQSKGIQAATVAAGATMSGKTIATTDIINTVETVGNSYFTGGVAGPTNVSRIVFNQGKLVQNSGILSGIKIVVSGNGNITLLQLRKSSGTYNIINSIVLTLSTGTNVLDLTSYNYAVQAGDFFAYQNAATGVITVSNATVAGNGWASTFYTPSGTVAIPSASVEGNNGNNTTYFYDVYVTQSQLSNLNTKISANSSVISAQQTLLNPVETIGNSYFTGGSAGPTTASRVIFNQGKFAQNNGILSGIKIVITSGSGTTTLLQLRKSNGNYLVINSIVLTLSAGTNIIDLTSYNYAVQAGDFFAYQNAATGVIPVTFANVPGNGYGSTFVTPVSGVVTIPATTAEGNIGNDNTYFYDVYVAESQITNINNNIANHSSAIASLQAAKQTRGTILFNDVFATIDTTNWINNGSWAPVTGGISPGATGLAASLILNKPYALDQRSARVVIRLASDTRFLLYTTAQNTGSAYCTIAEVNASTGKMIIYVASNGTTIGAISSQGNYTFLTDRDYVVELIINKTQLQNILRVTDTLTGVVTDLLDASNATGRQHDYYSMCCYSGTVPVIKSFHVNTPNKKRMLLFNSG